MGTLIHHSIENRKGFHLRYRSTAEIPGCRNYELRDQQEEHSYHVEKVTILEWVVSTQDRVK
jgi:hypothetical protein